MHIFHSDNNGYAESLGALAYGRGFEVRPEFLSCGYGIDRLLIRRSAVVK